MDWLFSKYASPFLFIDGMIQTCRFNEFVHEFNRIHEENYIWEIYLHKVFDKSYNEFKKSLMRDSTPVTSESIEITVKQSYDTISNFVPEN